MACRTEAPGVRSPERSNGAVAMAGADASRFPKLGRLRERLRRRRERGVERARARAEGKREWERSGKVGRDGVHEGWSSGGF